MTHDQLDRMILHNGDFGMSSWVDCCAPCCRSVRGDGPGWFAITAGTSHFFDPKTRQHVHAECYAAMRAAVKGEAA